jgi:hypothetical protein
VWENLVLAMSRASGAMSNPFLIANKYSSPLSFMLFAIENPLQNILTL